MAIVNIQDIFRTDRKKSFSFIFKQKIQDDFGNFTITPLVVPVDATLDENYSLTTTITQNEIQSGEIITDHIHILPQTVTVRCIVSEAPVFFLPSIARSLINAAVDRGFQALASTTQGSLLGSGLTPILGAIEKYAPTFIAGKLTYALLGSENRADIKRLFWQQYLKARFKEKAPFEIKSEVDNIKNVFFESINFDNDYSIGESIIFTATLKEIRVVQASIVRTSAGAAFHSLVRAGQTSTNILNEVEEDIDLPIDHVIEKPVSVKFPTKRAGSIVGSFLRTATGL